MKTFFLTLLVGVWYICLMPLQANNPLRTIPYPQQGHDIYLNPVPLIVPYAMKQSDYLQFNLSQEENFDNETSLLSEPVPWCVYNPHRILKAGTWYWRFRSVGQAGEKSPWSETYCFTITDDIPQFATPSFQVLLQHLPLSYPRIYCFLNEYLDNARKKAPLHPEFEIMIDDARDALSQNYMTDTHPYNLITRIAADCDKLNTAYQLIQRKLYADKMVENVRCLLAVTPDKNVIANDFKAGELVYTLACTYDNCRARFTEKEQTQIESLIMDVLSEYYYGRILGREENMFFDEHFWQFTFRHFLQSAIVLYDKYPLAKEYLKYSYELWTSRAPGNGFNRDGSWFNGANYFSANAVSLAYVAKLFSYLTGSDFLQHPWYKRAGLGLAYSWQPGALSDGFGDGHEKRNGKPLRIRSFFADFLARETGDPYATWYSSINDRYLQESETRLYRMTTDKQRPQKTDLPATAPKAVWFNDCGVMIANSDLYHPERNISLSFRSSPFGSGNHTHANQNAFNLHVGGEAVFHSIGHYMSYDDPHNLLSYRHTRAHNTLLINGVGQSFTQLAAGRMPLVFNGEHIAYALGDASQAYRDTSNIAYWKKSFATHHIEQTSENGFGATPLTRYKRHILMLYPNTVIIYDELEASKAVSWDWLLHSPVPFNINPDTRTLVTRNREKQFSAVTQFVSRQSCTIRQTDQYVVPPMQKRAERGEDFTNPWTLTASFGPNKSCRIVTIIQVESNNQKAERVVQKGNRIICGSWTIEAELDTHKSASLHICNDSHQATLDYNANGTTTIHDYINEKWDTLSTNKQPVLEPGRW